MTAKRGPTEDAPAWTSSIPKSMNPVPTVFDPSGRTTAAPTALPNTSPSMVHIGRPFTSRTWGTRSTHSLRRARRPQVVRFGQVRVGIDHVDAFEEGNVGSHAIPPIP